MRFSCSTCCGDLQHHQMMENPLVASARYLNCGTMLSV
jgi:hypothetical protein